MTQLKILMITHHRAYKVQFRSHAMAKHLTARGHSVHEMCIADTRRFGIAKDTKNGVTMIETPDLLWGRGRSGWDAWDTLNRIVYLARQGEDFDLIHCFETRPTTIYPALFYARRKGIPFVTDWVDWWGRGGIIDAFRPKWYRRWFGSLETYYEEAFRARGAGLTTISQALRQRAIDDLGVDAKQTLYLPNGTDLEAFPLRDKASCREHIGMNPDIPVLGFSSLDSHFDLDFVMQVLAYLKEGFPDVTLLITGKAGDDVMQNAAEHDVSDHIYRSGFVPFEELGWYLGACDVFVLPFPDTAYNRGRWPNKLSDYMSVGRPIVANPVGEVGHVLTSHGIGILAEWDVPAFVGAIAELLRDPGRATVMGRAARHLAENTYNWENLIIRLEDFYLDVLGEHTQQFMT